MENDQDCRLPPLKRRKVGSNSQPTMSGSESDVNDHYWHASSESDTVTLNSPNQTDSDQESVHCWKDSKHHCSSTESLDRTNGSEEHCNVTHCPSSSESDPPLSQDRRSRTECEDVGMTPLFQNSGESDSSASRELDIESEKHGNTTASQSENGGESDSYAPQELRNENNELGDVATGPIQCQDGRGTDSYASQELSSENEEHGGTTAGSSQCQSSRESNSSVSENLHQSTVSENGYTTTGSSQCQNRSESDSSVYDNRSKDDNYREATVALRHRRSSSKSDSAESQNHNTDPERRSEAGVAVGSSHCRDCEESDSCEAEDWSARVALGRIDNEQATSSESRVELGPYDDGVATYSLSPHEEGLLEDMERLSNDPVNSSSHQREVSPKVSVECCFIFRIHFQAVIFSLN